LEPSPEFQQWLDDRQAEKVERRDAEPAPDPGFQSWLDTRAGTAGTTGVGDSVGDGDQPDAPAFVGDHAGRAELWKPQGQFAPKVSETCTMASASQAMTDLGNPVSEQQLFERARATQPPRAEANGLSSPDGIARTMTDLGTPASWTDGHTIDDLADLVGDGHGVIAFVDAGRLWNDPRAIPRDGAPYNHAVYITDVEIDPATNEVTAIRLNDTAPRTKEQGADVRYTRAELEDAWAGRGGMLVVTDQTRPMPTRDPEDEP
jgi:hypothetical protein